MRPVPVGFVTSMPAAYRDAFAEDEDAIAIHAEIVARRGTRRVWVEAWRELPERTLALCVVADDQPGLMSRISAALVTEALDVVDAHAFCRTRADGLVEAVDFFWVKRVDERGEPVALRARQIEEISDAIEALVVASAPGEAPPRARHPTPPPPPVAPGSVRVRFDRDVRGGAVVLTVQAPDRPGLLLALTGALFRADVRIVGLRATSESGSAVDRFHLTELDGAPLSEDRMRGLQAVVFEAIASVLSH